MAYFIQVKSGETVFKKCLNAIEKVGKTGCEPWLDKFVEESEKNHRLAPMNVLLHWWKSFEDTDVNWEREEIYNSEPSYKYDNYQGVNINISRESRTGKSHVYHSIGLPPQIAEQLEGLDNKELYEKLEQFKNFINRDGVELQIKEEHR